MSLILKNINKNKGDDDFFESYLKTPCYPFSFLINNEGCICRALSKLQTSTKGFIRISDGTKEDQERQLLTAQDIINSNKVILDGTSVLFLSLSDSISGIIDSIKNVIVPKSVITMLQDLANIFTPTEHQMGRIGLVNERIQVSKIDVTKSENFRNLMLGAIDLLKSKAELVDSIAAASVTNKYMT